MLKKKHERFDIIIDDGSHKTKDQTFFLRNYEQLLSDDGQLICEDVEDDTFFRQMCGEEGVYGIDLSANRPEKTATDQHNDRILIKDSTLRPQSTASIKSEPLVQHPKIRPVPKIREGHTLHMLGIPYAKAEMMNTCAFDQRVWKSGDMFTDIGYTTRYYGHRNSKVSCTEHIVVTDDIVLEQTYGGFDYNAPPTHKINDYAFKVFKANAVREIRKRANKDDIVLAFYGQGHKALCDAISDLPVHIIEPSFGYPDPFSKNRVHQSISDMHFNRGQASHAARIQRKFSDQPELNITPWERPI